MLAAKADSAGTAEPYSLTYGHRAAVTGASPAEQEIAEGEADLRDPGDEKKALA